MNKTRWAKLEESRYKKYRNITRRQVRDAVTIMYEFMKDSIRKGEGEIFVIPCVGKLQPKSIRGVPYKKQVEQMRKRAKEKEEEERVKKRDRWYDKNESERKRKVRGWHQNSTPDSEVSKEKLVKRRKRTGKTITRRNPFDDPIPYE